MKNCEWCEVRLRWWQRVYCRVCKGTIKMQSHAGKGKPWTPRGSRRDAPPDRIRS